MTSQVFHDLYELCIESTNLRPLWPVDSDLNAMCGFVSVTSAPGYYGFPFSISRATTETLVVSGSVFFKFLSSRSFVKSRRL